MNFAQFMMWVGVVILLICVVTLLWIGLVESMTWLILRT